MFKFSLQILMVLIFLSSYGCGNGAISGGTAGRLMSDGNPLGDFKITAYESPSFEAIGFASTKNDGSFQLIKQNSKENLWLPKGEYVFTVESIGSEVVIPEEYFEPKTTPLKFDWNDDDELELNIPNLKEPK